LTVVYYSFCNILIAKLRNFSKVPPLQLPHQGFRTRGYWENLILIHIETKHTTT